MITDPASELGGIAKNVWPLISVDEKSVRAFRGAKREGLAGLPGDEGGGRPASDYAVENSVHISANPPAAPNGKIHDGGQYKAIGGIVRADGMFGLQLIELLDVSSIESSYECVKPCGRIIRCFGKSVIAFEADIVAGTLLKAYLKRVVRGAGGKQSKSAESSGELRIGTQKVDERNLGIVID